MRWTMSRLRGPYGLALPSMLVAAVGCTTADDFAVDTEAAAADESPAEPAEVTKAWAVNEEGDHFGDALVTGDFDADGYRDVAVGATGEAPGAEPRAGAVFVFRGSATGLAPWRVLTQESRPMDGLGNLRAALASNDDGDRFGGELAVGDFNGDRIDDLAVGIAGKADSAGAVMVFTGHRQHARDERHGLVAWSFFDQSTLGAEDEALGSFGVRLAAGNFDGVGADELAVTAFAGAYEGAVFVVRPGADALLQQTLTAASLSAGSRKRFGFALASGDLDNDGDDELVVGAPYHSERDGLVVAGAVAFFRGGATLTPWHWQLEPGGAGYYHTFGEQVAVGQLDGRGGSDVLARASRNGDGVLYVLRVDASSPTPVLWATVAESDPRDDARTTDSLAIGRIVGDDLDDIVVGAPSNRTGRATVYRNTGTGFVRSGATPLGAVGAGDADRLGTGVAVLSVAGGPSTLLVSAPGADDGAIADTGAIYQFGISGDPLPQERRIWQRR